MKKIKAVLLFTVLCSMSVFAKKKEIPALPSVQETFSADKTNRQLGYQLIENGDKIVFIFDYKLNDLKGLKIDAVSVEGSFNGWNKGTNEDWLMEKERKSGLWFLTKNSEEVRIPGNSGFPEFKFYVKYQEPYVEYLCGQELHRTRPATKEPAAASKIPGFKMATNNLILFPGDSPDVVVENTKIADTVKKLKEFDLSKPEDVAAISNVRVVPGTTKLFRGYHPYKMSRNQFDTEKKRIELVNQAIENNGVKSIITLSGNEQAISGKETISNYITNLNMNGNHLFVDTSYNVVYYESGSKKFGELMGTIIKFIGAHPGPYYIHCRLGTDRTGTTSAYLAALCGADWNDICADYQKSNNTGIKEFRDYRLLQYSFEHLLGKPMSEVKDLQKETADYFVKRGYATQAEIDACVKNLR